MSEDSSKTNSRGQAASGTTGTGAALVRGSAEDSRKADDKGPPTSAWAVAAVCVPIISGYSWLFKVVDKSEFPEGTFENPFYWLLLALFFLVALLWAVRLQKKGSWLDRGILALVFLGMGISIMMAIRSNSEAQPSNKVFTVVIFNPPGDTDERSKQAGYRLRNSLQSELKGLESKIGVPVDVSLKHRPPSDSEKDQITDVRKWASRRKGAHWAIWPEVSVRPDGKGFQGKIHYVKVHDFGVKVNEEELDTYDHYDEDPFNDHPNAVGDGNSVDPQVIQQAVSSLRFFWGVAAYRQGNYDMALQVLPSGVAFSEFYLGESALEKALAGKTARDWLSLAIRHFESAISLYNPEDRRKAAFYARLADAHAQRRDYFGSNPQEETNEARHAYEAAESIYENQHDPVSAASMKLQIAKCLFNLNVQMQRYHGTGDPHDLRLAGTIISDSLAMISRDSELFFYAKDLMAGILNSERRFAEAIEDENEAVDHYRKSGSSDDLARALIALGVFKMNSGLNDKNEDMYEAAWQHFEEAGKVCRRTDACLDAHQFAAKVDLDWADLKRRRSKSYLSLVQNAIKESESAASLVSKTERPQEFALVMELAARSYEYLVDVPDNSDPIASLKQAVGKLSEAIAVLGDNNPDSIEFLTHRARDFRTLAEIVSPAEAATYKNRAKWDDDRAKALGLKKPHAQ